MTVPFRILSLLLCLLIAGPMSTPAWALARPENRVGNFFQTSPKSAAADHAQTAGTRWENPACGYDFASGVCKYLYCHADPVNGWDPSGHFDLITTMATFGMRTWESTKEQWVNYPVASRIAVTLSLTGLGFAFYDFYYAPGVAGFKTVDGKKKSLSFLDHASRLTDLLNQQGEHSVAAVTMTGHSDEASFKIGLDMCLLSGSDSSYSLNDEKQGDVIAAIKRAIIPTGKIYLNGCHSAELAQKMSTVLQGVEVFGFKIKVFGLKGVRINGCVSLPGSQTSYTNGVEKNPDED